MPGRLAGRGWKQWLELLLLGGSLLAVDVSPYNPTGSSSLPIRGPASGSWWLRPPTPPQRLPTRRREKKAPQRPAAAYFEGLFRRWLSAGDMHLALQIIRTQVTRHKTPHGLKTAVRA
jgi:hypothetical protein